MQAGETEAQHLVKSECPLFWALCLPPPRHHGNGGGRGGHFFREIRRGKGLKTCNVLDLPRDARCEGGIDVCAQEDQKIEEASEQRRARQPSLFRGENSSVSGNILNPLDWSGPPVCTAPKKVDAFLVRGTRHHLRPHARGSSGKGVDSDPANRT